MLSYSPESHCTTWNFTFECPTWTPARWFMPQLQCSVLCMSKRWTWEKKKKKKKQSWQTGMLKNCQRQKLHQWWQQFEYLSPETWWIGSITAERSLPLGHILMPQVQWPAQSWVFWVHGLCRYLQVLFYSRDQFLSIHTLYVVCL